jgi:hypothetical protein
MNGFIRRDVIKGVSYFEGDIDGNRIESGACFIEEPLDVSKGRSKGFRTVEYKLKEIEIAKGLINFDYPLSAEVHFELLTTKRGQSIVISAVKPIEVVRGQPQSEQRKAA